MAPRRRTNSNRTPPRCFYDFGDAKALKIRPESLKPTHKSLGRIDAAINIIWWHGLVRRRWTIDRERSWWFSRWELQTSVAIRWLALSSLYLSVCLSSFHDTTLLLVVGSGSSSRSASIHFDGHEQLCRDFCAINNQSNPIALRIFLSPLDFLFFVEQLQLLSYLGQLVSQCPNQFNCPFIIHSCCRRGRLIRI